MTIIKTLPVLLLSLAVLRGNAQTDIPKGFKNGTIVLADSSIVSGYIKDNMKSQASVTFFTSTSTKKQQYSGSELSGASIEDVRYTCINGDFFKVICQGELCFLQKVSDASGKPSYNGAEAVFTSGTEGKPSDYFIYDSRTKTLNLLSKRNAAAVATSAFGTCTEAIDKAKNINGDVSQLKEAVDTYNNRNSK
jgi:hypothetical protein